MANSSAGGGKKTGGGNPPKYRVPLVEALILELVAEPHSTPRSADELLLSIVGDTDDAREVETVGQAIAGLREFGLLEDREENLVEPTRAGFHAVTLLREAETPHG
jgi:hypothetical protein